MHCLAQVVAHLKNNDVRRRAGDRVPKLEPERRLRGPQDATLVDVQAGTDHVGRERQLERRREDDFGKQLPQFVVAVRLDGGQFGRDRREALHQEHLVPELRAVAAAAACEDVVQDAAPVWKSTSESGVRGRPGSAEL